MSQAELDHALSLHRQGHFEAAGEIYQKLTASDPNLAEPWHLLGVIELQSGHFDLSEPYFRKALDIDPKHAKCLTNLGAALYEMDRLDEARLVLLSALQVDPSYPNARFNLGNVLLGLGDNEAALSAFETVLKAAPDHVGALINAGILSGDSHLNAKARSYLEKSLKLAPENFTGLLHLSVILERLNALTEAQTCIDQALAQQPNHALANLQGARLDLRHQKPESALVRLNPLIKREENDALKIETLFVFGQALDVLHRSDEAFAAFEGANALERVDALRCDVDPLKFQAIVNLAHDRMDAGPVVSSLGNDQHSPVFFVGFPRSGTTLFEQMLSKHSAVVTTNEESPLAILAKSVDLSKSFNGLDEDALGNLRTQFWHLAEKITGGINGRLLIDKMPMNIHLLDLAVRLFPQAKVVMALRDPRDVCLSSFLQNFAQTNALANFQTLEETAWVYDRLMSLWIRQKNELPMSWIEFRYEDLVQGLEATVTPVLDFMGLNWVDEILSYQDQAQKGHIVTPSYAQVGEKLHSRAKGRWLRYERHLEPIMDQLSPYIQAFGYGD